MKFLFVIMGFVFLASCSHVTPEESLDSTEVVATQKSIETQEIEEDQETQELDDDESEEVKDEDQDELLEEVSITTSNEIVTQTQTLNNLEEDSSKTMTLDAGYTNPKGSVDMAVSYSIDKNGLITAIGVSATTYDVSDFNSDIQSLIGQTLDDAVNYKTGSSLTGDAFKKVIKNQL